MDIGHELKERRSKDEESWGKKMNGPSVRIVILSAEKATQMQQFKCKMFLDSESQKKKMCF